MADVTKIIIKGSSGYCSIEYAYEDKLVLTENSISYHLLPEILKEKNKRYFAYVDHHINEQKWSYKTNSDFLKEDFKLISELALRILSNQILEFCTDVGYVEITVVFSDKTRKKEMYWLSHEYFTDLFKVIQKWVPSGEKMPAVIETYDEEDEE